MLMHKCAYFPRKIIIIQYIKPIKISEMIFYGEMLLLQKAHNALWRSIFIFTEGNEIHCEKDDVTKALLPFPLFYYCVFPLF